MKVRMKTSKHSLGYTRPFGWTTRKKIRRKMTKASCRRNREAAV